jgi:hypothetical protein
MRALYLLAVPAVLLGAAKPSTHPLPRLLAQIPSQAAVVIISPNTHRLEAKWAKVTAPFGGGGRLLDFKQWTGIEASRLGTGPLAELTFLGQGGSQTMVWLLPSQEPKALMQGLNATHKGWTWSWTLTNPASNSTAQGEPQTRFALARAGYLVVATREIDLAPFRKPAATLAAELAPYLDWMGSHDLSVVATQAAVAEAARSAKAALQAPAGEGKPEAETAAAPKVVAEMRARLSPWVEKAGLSVHHGLLSLDITEGGSVAFEVRAMLTKDSPLSRDLAAKPAAAGHPLEGLSAPGFALAFGGEWSGFPELQATLLELGGAGKVQPATKEKLKQSLAAQNALVRSWAGSFAAPAPRAALMSGMTSLVRVTDAQAYLATLESASQAQNALLHDLGTPGAVTFERDTLPGVPSCTLTTRMSFKDDPSTASARTALTMLFGGEAVVMSLGALDEHRVLAVMGGADLLKARLEEARNAPPGLAPSIQAVTSELGQAPRFAFYVDPVGLRELAQSLLRVFGSPGATTLPELPFVPAAGLTLSLDPAMVQLRGAVLGETLRATATLFKALGALIPKPKGQAAPAGEPSLDK